MPYNWSEWKKKDPHAERVARRFRHHVRTVSNPRGRIIREACTFCPAGATAGGHHLDYAKPFVVVWACEPCHRKIERGEIKIRAKDVWDYTSLVKKRPTRWSFGRGARAAPPPTETEETVPF
jgi:hypothetical protein